MKLDETRYIINVGKGQIVKYTWQTRLKMITANALVLLIALVSFTLFVWSVYELLFGF